MVLFSQRKDMQFSWSIKYHLKFNTYWKGIISFKEMSAEVMSSASCWDAEQQKTHEGSVSGVSFKNRKPRKLEILVIPTKF